MKTQKLLIIGALAGLTLGSLMATSVAGAQGYGGDADTTTVESTDDDSGQIGSGDLVVVQDTEQGDIDPGDSVQGDTDRRQGRRGGCGLAGAAEAIGIGEDDLRAELDSGQTIAEVTEANGADVDVVIDAMVTANSERLADKVEQGRITQEEADAKLAEAESRVTARVYGSDDSGAQDTASA